MLFSCHPTLKTISFFPSPARHIDTVILLLPFLSQTVSFSSLYCLFIILAPALLPTCTAKTRCVYLLWRKHTYCCYSYDHYSQLLLWESLTCFKTQHLNSPADFHFFKLQTNQSAWFCIFAIHCYRVRYSNYVRSISVLATTYVNILSSY